MSLNPANPWMRRNKKGRFVKSGGRRVWVRPRRRKGRRKWGSRAQVAAFRKMRRALARKLGRRLSPLGRKFGGRVRSRKRRRSTAAPRARRVRRRAAPRARKRVRLVVPAGFRAVRRKGRVVIKPKGTRGTQLSLFKNPGKRRRRKNMAFLANPRRRRRNPGRRRSRRNPGIGGGLKGAFRNIVKAGIPAAVGGFAMGFIDSKLLAGRGMLARVGGKLAGAAAAGLLLRRNPAAAYATMGAMLGTLGYEPGVRMGGGVIATSKPAGVKELAAMAAEDEESMALLENELSGMGLLEEGIGASDDVMPDLGAQEDVVPDLGDEDDISDIADDDD